MKLFKVSMVSVNKWDIKKRILYVIQPSKIDAIKYVNETKNDNFIISKIWYLGHELSGRMFKGGKEFDKA
jgi:hypothetical protein